MMKRVNPLSKYKLVYRPAKPALKIALLGVLVLSTAALVTMSIVIHNKHAQAAADREKSQSLIAENQDLQDKIDKHGSKDGVKDYAEEELGMVDKDSVIFVPGN
jgi:cell division protein FtsB